MTQEEYQAQMDDLHAQRHRRQISATDYYRATAQVRSQRLLTIDREAAARREAEAEAEATTQQHMDAGSTLVPTMPEAIPAPRYTISSNTFSNWDRQSMPAPPPLRTRPRPVRSIGEVLDRMMESPTADSSSGVSTAPSSVTILRSEDGRTIGKKRKLKKAS